MTPGEEIARCAKWSFPRCLFVIETRARLECSSCTSVGRRDHVIPPHLPFSHRAAASFATASSARGERTTATRRPCSKRSTRPKAATSFRRPSKSFFASLADTYFAIRPLCQNAGVESDVGSELRASKAPERPSTSPIPSPSTAPLYSRLPSRPPQVLTHDHRHRRPRDCAS